MIKSYIELKKDSQKDNTGLTQHKLSVIGDCATQYLAIAIKGYAVDAGFNIEIFDADYNQIKAQIFDADSELYAFTPDSVLIYMCTGKLYERFCATSFEDRLIFADELYEEILGYWILINKQIKTNIFQYNFVEIDDGIFGNFSNKTNISFTYQLRKLNYLLMDGCQSMKNVFLLDLCSIQNRFGRDFVYDSKLYYIAKLPLTMNALPIAAKQVVDMIKALSGKVKKCVILDLDNTIWGGVIGDDGLEGIQIGELGLGQAFSNLQLWLKELKNRGIILAVCSKNNEDTAKEPFINHPDMVLRLTDISVFVANWEDKASNIKHIQQTLNIGMDSIVFIDDNPFERHLVQGLIPQITVPELPEDPALYLGFLNELNLFETASFSEVDKERTNQYQAEIGRKIIQQKYESFDDYLQSLDMVATVAPFDKFHYPRIAQLTQRSNQFNLRTVRYTEAEIESITNNDKYITLYFCLKDKYGDYGLISVVIMDKEDDGSLFISEWLMSCRVLKRGMEEFIINKIIRTAKETGFAKVVGQYIRTPKNEMVENIYERMGFAACPNNLFEAIVDNFKYNNTYIKE